MCDRLAVAGRALLVLWRPAPVLAAGAVMGHEEHHAD